jgi:hypothetical protein
MIILSHILIAIISLIQASLLVVSPSRRGVQFSYGLIGLTLLSGTFLVFSTQRPLLQTCLAGLGYSIVAVGATVYARRRLAAIQ